MITNLETKQPPKYARLAQQIKGDIACGKLAPGDQIASFAALRREYGATPATVERIISSLEREGLVERKHGKGVFVRLRPPALNVSPIKSGITSKTVAIINVGVDRVQLQVHRASGWSRVMFDGVADSLRDSSLNAIAINTYSSTDTVAEEVIGLGPRGLIIPDIGGSPDPVFRLARLVAAAGIPVVAYRGGDDLIDIDRVASDFSGGSYELTKWLIARGRRRIINVWPDIKAAYWYSAREAGYRRAMVEAGLEALPVVLTPYLNYVPNADEMRASVKVMAGYMAEHLTAPASVDAVMAVSDGVCPEVAAALRLFRKEPNVDVDIVGYDNIGAEIVCDHLDKVLPLATVDKQNHLIGEALVQLLNDRCDDKLGTAPVRRMTPQRLIVFPPVNEIKM